MYKLRRVLGALEPQQALELLLDRIRRTRTNIEFLRQVQMRLVEQARRRRLSAPTSVAAEVCTPSEGC